MDKDIQLFGFFKGECYYTNIREILNWDWNLEDCLEYIDFSNYKIFRGVAPYFVYQQLRTHGQMDFVSHSQRYADSALGYWMPKDIEVIVKGVWRNPEMFDNTDWDRIVESRSSEELKSLIKKVSNRKEVYDRGADMLQYRSFCIGGYVQPNGWIHFIKQRVHDKHTQLETRDFCSMFEEFIDL